MKIKNPFAMGDNDLADFNYGLLTGVLVGACFTLLVLFLIIYSNR
jgi:hypothetical protein